MGNNRVKTQGYGMIEIVIVLAIVIILAVAAVPTLVTLYQRYHVTTLASDLYYKLQYAKNQAIKTNQTIYVVFQTGDNWCYGINAGATCNCTIANNCNLGSTATDRTEDVTMAVSSMSGSSLQFEGVNGMTITGGTVTFTIYNDTPSMGVKVNALGNSKLCSSTISGYPSCS